VLGGSSVLNYLLYVRGNKHDYNLWEALGNPGWGAGEVLKYFKVSIRKDGNILSMFSFMPS